MNILITASFSETSERRIREIFPKDWMVSMVPPSELEKYLPSADVLIPEHMEICGEIIKKAPRLRLVQTGAGCDNVDIEDCSRRGIRVCNAAGVNANAVAEHVMAFILSFFKNIPRLDSFMKGRGPGAEPDYRGSELRGKTVGIIGLGHTGRRVAELCRAFNMRVLGCSRHGAKIPGISLTDSDTLYRESDIVTLHVPLNDSTRHMLDGGALKRMKRTALLINTSRGQVVDEAALIEALQNHELAGACLDVFEREPLPEESPLRDMENVILTPHTAGLPDGMQFHRARYEFFLSNILKTFAGEEPDCALNGPEDKLWGTDNKK
ncbi:MAG: NAD(P)-dependent oxidoreductase [Candidatus Limivicinus sp.]|jgi:phosphoglycerate dehydrogenase-like enzyme